MLEILLTLVLAYVLATASGVLAAKKRSSRRVMSNYMRGDVNEVLALGTLASLTLVADIFDQVVDNKTKATSIIASYSMNSATMAAGVGPVLVGLAHSDYTDAEIEEVIESVGSWTLGNKVSQEVAKRQVRRIGTFPQPINAGDAVVLNDGKPIRTKLNWILMEGQSLRIWAYNLGSAAFATTDPQVHCEGHINLFSL